MEVLEHVSAIVVAQAKPGRDLCEERLLGKIEADHLRNEGVDGLVVGDAVPRGIGERDVALGVGAHESRNADEAVLAEHLGIEERLVGAAVDDVDAAAAESGTQPHLVVVDPEVGGLDELEAHRAGEEAVLEVGRVVGAGGEEHHRRGIRRGGGDGAQRLGEARGVVVDAPDAGRLERAREHALRDEAVLEHVADAARRPQVVLEDAIGASRIADEIDSAQVHADAARRFDSAQIWQVVLGAEDQLARDLPFGEDALLAVDVVEEEGERADPLDETPLEIVPSGRRDESRQEAEGKDLLGALIALHHREGDALVEERQLGERDAAGELGGRPGGQRGEGSPELGAECGAALEQLVVGTGNRLVLVEDIGAAAAFRCASLDGGRLARRGLASERPIARRGGPCVGEPAHVHVEGNAGSRDLARPLDRRGEEGDG